MSKLQEYLDASLGKVVFDKKEETVACRLGRELIRTRVENGMTQKQLAETTNIQQANISKIENGVGNPSLKVLERIATGMGKSLVIKFE